MCICIFASFYICLLLFAFFQVQAVLKRKEEEDQQMKQMVKTLQIALEKEQTKVKDLKEQVGTFFCVHRLVEIIFSLIQESLSLILKGCNVVVCPAGGSSKG